MQVIYVFGYGTSIKLMQFNLCFDFLLWIIVLVYFIFFVYKLITQSNKYLLWNILYTLNKPILVMAFIFFLCQYCHLFFMKFPSVHSKQIIHKFVESSFKRPLYLPAKFCAILMQFVQFQFHKALSFMLFIKQNLNICVFNIHALLH